MLEEAVAVGLALRLCRDTSKDRRRGLADPEASLDTMLVVEALLLRYADAVGVTLLFRMGGMLLTYTTGALRRRDAALAWCNSMRSLRIVMISFALSLCRLMRFQKLFPMIRLLMRSCAEKAGKRSAGCDDTKSAKSVLS